MQNNVFVSANFLVKQENNYLISNVRAFKIISVSDFFGKIVPNLWQNHFDVRE